MKKTIIAIIILVFTVVSLCSAAGKFIKFNMTKKEKIKIVFVIDQGFGNGAVVWRDTVGMERIVEALKPLQKYYDVYPLFGPHVKDKQSLEMMLDICVKNDMPFMFDAASSDGMALAGAPQSAAADPAHGCEISLQDLDKYKKRYGKYLAGIRLMEIFGQDYTVREITTRHPEWVHGGYRKKPDANVPFFDPAIVSGYLKFARDNSMFVQWSEFHWFHGNDWDPYQKERERKFLKLLKEFPNLITVTYANNEPAFVSIPRLKNWHEDVEPLVKAGAKDFGLSNQAWLYPLDVMNCPIDDIIAWTERTFDLGCRYIQYEPGFYYFNIPPGTLLPPQEDYTKDPNWENRGASRETFKKLFEYLIKRAS